MSFLDQIFARLETSADRALLVELSDSGREAIAGHDLLNRVAQARAFLAGRNFGKGDRCAVLAPNSINWVAMDLAIMAEGLIVVPLYSRQAAPELVAMMKDCSPSLIVCGDPGLREGIVHDWPDAPPQVLFDEVFTQNAPPSPVAPPAPHDDSDPVAIIYTSGTSGEGKGVVLTAGNLAHMLACTPVVKLKCIHRALEAEPDDICAETQR